MTPVLIGYFPKRIARPPHWMPAAGVTAIYSVSNCISDSPPDWFTRWTHNDLWVQPTVADANAVIPTADADGYEVLAYRMVPAEWDNGIVRSIELPDLTVEPLPAGFESLGFDAVSWEDCATGFGHSPLSCNSMATVMGMNENCLLADLASAVEAARRFSLGEGEPGPYRIVEVLRPSRRRDL